MSKMYNKVVPGTVTNQSVKKFTTPTVVSARNSGVECVWNASREAFHFTTWRQTPGIGAQVLQRGRAGAPESGRAAGRSAASRNECAQEHGPERWLSPVLLAPHEGVGDRA